MHQKVQKKILTLSIFSFFFLFAGCAAKNVDSPASTQPSEQVQTVPQANTSNSDKMDMSQMKMMMQQCKTMHKNRKMCDKEMMSKCLEKMDKGDCKKLMKQAKVDKDSIKK